MEVINGVRTEHHFCTQCAKEMDFGAYSAIFDGEFPLAKLISGLLGGEEPEEKDGKFQQVVCPSCGMTYEEFVENSCFGCADCYSVFDLLIRDNIKQLQGSECHKGKHPKIRPAGETRQAEDTMAVDVQAQNASLRLFAEQKLTLSSASDISFAGKKRITLIGGGSYLRLEAGKVEYGTTATYIRKVKRTMFAGANSTPTPSISIPLVDDLIRNGFFDEQFRILDDSGKPMANVPYFISSENGETFKGVTDNQGLCKRVFSKESAKLTVWLGVLALERW